MIPNIKKEHAVETFKSLIQISVEGLKLLAVFNGGAYVALLAYLGNVAVKGASTPDMRFPMVCYLAGLVSCGIAFFASYFAQVKKDKPSHFNITGIATVLRLKSPYKNNNRSLSLFSPISHRVRSIPYGNGGHAKRIGFEP